MNILVIFQIFSLWTYLDKNFDKYPIKKKNIREAIEAPTPKDILSLTKKFLEKFPRKKMVSE